MKSILLAISVFVFGFALMACDGGNNNVTVEPTDVENVEEGVYGLGDTFQFDGSNGLLELTFGEDITFTTIDNEFSDLDGADVVVLPVTMTNIGDATGSLNMFDVTVFGSSGVSLEDIYFIVDGDDIRSGNDLRSGASVESYFHLLYDGDGEYVLEFDSYSTSVEVTFEVEKN